MLEELQELPSALRPFGDLMQEAVEMRWVVIDCDGIRLQVGDDGELAGGVAQV